MRYRLITGDSGDLRGQGGRKPDGKIGKFKVTKPSITRSKEIRDREAFTGGLKMKLRKLALLPIAAAVMAFGTPAIANSLDFQGVTFNTFAVDADTLQLSILNADAATGDWTGVNYLKAFEVKNIGNVTGVSLITPANVSVIDQELTAKGCTGGNADGICFSAPTPISLTNYMSWTIDFTGTGLHFDSPSLKVEFLTSIDGGKTGSLLSQPIPAIPEPETYAMLLAGLGLMAFVARRRKSLGNLVPA